MKKSQTHTEFERQEIRLKSYKTLQQRKERQAQYLLMQQQEQSIYSITEQITQQQLSTQQ